MHESKTLKASLSLSGIIFAAVGATLLLAPAVMHGSNGVVLGSDPSLLSEIRAPGGALLALGALVLAGAFSLRLTYPATVIAATVYLAYGFSRILSMALDGLPAPGLILVAVLEIALGVVNGVLLMRLRQEPVSS